MFEQTLIKINKFKLYITMDKNSRKRINSITTADDYIQVLSQEQKKYTPSILEIVDKEAISNSRKSDLFCDIGEYKMIKERYNFPYCANNSDIENTIKIMSHLTERTFYCGYSSCFIPDNTIKILKYSYGKDFSHSINCRFKAIALSDILLAYGIKALPICMLSQNGGCHFVVHVFSRELNKFFVCDPSFNCYFTDDDGKVMSVFELRKSFIENKKVNIIGYNFLGCERFKELYISMFIKDCLSNISTWSTNKRDKKINTKMFGIDFKTIVPESI